MARWGLAAAAALLAAGAVLASGSASTARDYLLQGRRAMERGRVLLASGRAADALLSFRAAEDSFGRAAQAARSPVLRVAGWVPILGRSPDVAVSLASAGGAVARAGQEIAEAVRDIPGGPAALSPRNGVVPVERFAPLARALRRAEGLVGSALATVRGTSGSLLLGPVGEARDVAVGELASIHRTLSLAAALVDRLPSFLGADGPRRYFVGGQNLAELRGSGGFVGAFALLRADGGRLEFSGVRPTDGFPRIPPGRLASPGEDYARNYNQFGGAGEWSNNNMTPDFPSAARAILIAYEAVTGDRLDGVILADPFALAALLRVTGPVDVPELGVRVDAGNAVDFASNQVYSLVRDQDRRKVVLGLLSTRVFERFLQGGARTVGGLRTLAQAVLDGHIRVYTRDPEMQAALVEAGAGGALTAPEGDFLSIVQNNAGANKIDYYLDRSVGYTVQLEDDGSATATVTVELANGAPASGQPAYVIGPTELPRGSDEPGENVAILNLYCAASCRLRGAARDGEDLTLTSGRELGFPFYQDYFSIGSGRTTNLRLSLAVDRAWEGNDSGGTYRLTFLNQATLRPTRLRLEVRAPAGMSIVATSIPMAVAGDRAVWEGTPGPRLEVEVRFQPPLALRLWRDVLRFLREPVVRL